MLEVRGLGKEYKDKVALYDVDLLFPDKGLVIIKGESGCGKSTLLNLLTASDMPTYGKILFAGVEITSANCENYRLKYCSNIYQDYMLLEDLTVGENIELAMQVCGQSYTIDDIKNVLQAVGIPEEYMNKKTSKLSGGEKQRVAIARSISKKEAMIFADEPTGNLDSKNGDTVMKILKEISAERLVVVVSHNERQNEMYGDYFVELFDGIVKNHNLQTADNDESKNVVLQKRSGELKPKAVVRLAFWGFEKNRIKTVISIIAFIALCIMSIVSTVAIIGDINLALSKSLDKCDGKGVFIEFENREKGINYGEAKKDFIENIDYDCLDICDFNIENVHYEVDEKEYKNTARVGLIKRAVVYDEKVGVDVKVLYGDFPKNQNDIMLPSYFAEYMARVFKEFKCDDIKKLVGKEMKYNTNGRSEAYYDYFTFRICGIFDEGAYFNDYDELSYADQLYLSTVNLLAESVILSKYAREIMFNNAYIFSSSKSILVDFYFETLLDGINIHPYCFDKYSSYVDMYDELNEGEIYLDINIASEYNIVAGSRVELSTWDVQPKFIDGKLDFEKVKVDSVFMTVKKLIDLPEKNAFVIFSRQDYIDTVLKENYIENTWGFYFNAKNIKNTYSFFNNISANGKKSKLWQHGLNGLAHTENSYAIHSLYSFFINYRSFAILPIMILSYIGMFALGFVSLSYLISSKSKSYNIMRSIGFGKRQIALILAIQIFTVIAVECIFGIAFGALGCFLFGKSFISLVDSGVTLAIANEVVMPIGYISPFLMLTISIFIGGVMVLLKTKGLFSKSIIANKTS